MIDNSYGRGKGQRAQSALARGDRSYIKITTREKPESRTWYLEQWQPAALLLHSTRPIQVENVASSEETEHTC